MGDLMKYSAIATKIRAMESRLLKSGRLPETGRDGKRAAGSGLSEEDSRVQRPVWKQG